MCDRRDEDSTMNARRLILVAGAIILIAGVIALLVPVSITGNGK